MKQITETEIQQAAEAYADQKFTKASKTYSSASTITAIRENCISDYIAGAKSDIAARIHAPVWIPFVPNTIPFGTLIIECRDLGDCFIYATFRWNTEAENYSKLNNVVAYQILKEYTP